MMVNYLKITLALIEIKFDHICLDKVKGYCIGITYMTCINYYFNVCRSVSFFVFCFFSAIQGVHKYYQNYRFLNVEMLGCSQKDDDKSFTDAAHLFYLTCKQFCTMTSTMNIIYRM